MEREQRWFLPLLVGGLLGAALVPLLTYLGSSFVFPGGCFVLPDMVDVAGSLPLAAAVQSVLGGLLGAAAGAAVLPFADDGRTLLLRSLLHALVTLASFSLLLWGCRWATRWQVILLWDAVLLGIYALIWLGRWVGWYMEVEAIRKKLGLKSGPSPLKWRETLPYLLFLILVCCAAPILLRAIDRNVVKDVPVFSGLLYPYLVLPAVTFCAGLSLGKRQGIAPLFPLAAGLFYLPMVFLLFNHTAWFHCVHAAVPALLGNAAGWAIRRRRLGGE